MRNIRNFLYTELQYVKGNEFIGQNKNSFFLKANSILFISHGYIAIFLLNVCHYNVI